MHRNRTRTRSPDCRPAGHGAIALLVVIDVLMLGLSVAAAWLGQAAVATIAGSGFVALSNQIARGLLSRRTKP